MSVGYLNGTAGNLSHVPSVWNNSSPDGDMLHQVLVFTNASNRTNSTNTTSWGAAEISGTIAGLVVLLFSLGVIINGFLTYRPLAPASNRRPTEKSQLLPQGKPEITGDNTEKTLVLPVDPTETTDDNTEGLLVLLDDQTN
jgi:hypothetical protein